MGTFILVAYFLSLEYPLRFSLYLPIYFASRILFIEYICILHSTAWIVYTQLCWQRPLQIRLKRFKCVHRGFKSNTDMKEIEMCSIQNDGWQSTEDRRLIFLNMYAFNFSHSSPLRKMLHSYWCLLSRCRCGLISF